MKKLLFYLIVFINVSTFAQSSQVTTYAGSTSGYLDGNLLSAQFANPYDLVKDSAGNIYVADVSNHCIRKIALNGTVSTFAGTNSPGFLDGNGSTARFRNPTRITIDSSNNLYVSDTNNHSIRKITPSGDVTTIAGTGVYGYNNGAGNVATFNSPGGLDIDENGNLFIGDRANYVIRKITPQGLVSTFAGSGMAGLINGASSVARFYGTDDLVFDANGDLFVADSYNNCIRKVDVNGNVSTFAGSIILGSQDGTGVNAGFAGPYAIDIDSFGNLFVADSGNRKIRKITSSGVVTTFAGSGTFGYLDGGSNIAQFKYVDGILVDSQGNVYVSDGTNDKIRKITPNLTGGNSCANATALSTNSATVNISTINGTIPSGNLCYTYSQANPNANWWSFTPTQNGVLDITTVTPQNASTVDTRISIYNGTCAALTCVAGNDNVSTTDLRSNLNNIILQAGTTYYFVFDDKVSDSAAVNFFYEFTPQTCFVPTSFTSALPTENTVTLNWNAPATGNAPQSYTIQIGPRDYTVDSSAAIQTITGVSGTSYTITGLNPNTVYDVYIKSNCSTTDSSVWNNGLRVYTEFTAVNPTYSENFDSDDSFLYVGWNRSGGTSSTLWRTYTGSVPYVVSGTRSIYSLAETTLNTPANVYAYSRKLNLVNGQNYTVSYKTRQFLTSGVTTSGYLQVNYVPNSSYTNTATHSQINALTSISASAYQTLNHNFNVPSTGEYRIAFRNALERTTGTGSAWLFLDDVVVSTALSVNEFEKSGLQMYPNPVLDFITLQNPENIKINNYSVLDMNGRVLLSKPYSVSNEVIDLSSLSKGIYFIQLDSEKGTLSKKIIKE